MITNEIRYKEYKLEGLLDSWQLYKEENSEIDYEATIIKTFQKQFSVSEDEYNGYKEKYSDIPKIKKKYTGERKKEFNVIEFYDWYTRQDQSCGYCGITQDELYELFANTDNRVLPLNDAQKRSSGTLEIERKDSQSNIYDSTNSILACPLCNNAKSNLIGEESWRNLFVNAMRNYYEKLLGKKLEKPNPSI